MKPVIYILSIVIMSICYSGCQKKLADISNTPETPTTVPAQKQADTAVSEKPALDPMACKLLELNLKKGKGGKVYLRVSDLTVSYEAVENFDFLFQRKHPGPFIKLGPGVSGLNLGNEKNFAEVVSAPTAGYITDEGDNPDEGTMVIGRDWYSGGQGSSGFEMSNNVYLLKLADGSFAKIMVNFAKKGEVIIDAFRPVDGSADISCK
jgi:hypothetical protein